MSKFLSFIKWDIPVMAVCTVVLASKWNPVKTDSRNFQKLILSSIHTL
mgnify:FL=1